MWWLPLTIAAVSRYEGSLFGVKTRIETRVNDITVGLDGWQVGGKVEGTAQWNESNGKITVTDPSFERFLDRRGVQLIKARRWEDECTDSVVVDIKLPIIGKQQVVLQKI